MADPPRTSPRRTTEESASSCSKWNSRTSEGSSERIERYPIRVRSYSSLKANGTKSRRPSFRAYLSPDLSSLFFGLARVHVSRGGAPGAHGGISFGADSGPVESSKNHFHVHGCPHYGYMHRPGADGRRVRNGSNILPGAESRTKIEIGSWKLAKRFC